MTTPSVKLAAARSRIYSLLAASFSCPDALDAEAVTCGDLAQELALCLTLCLPEAAEEVDRGMMALAAASVTADLQAEFLITFHTNIPQPSASLYESSYLQGCNKPALLLELKAFYRHFGLIVAPELHELEDSLSSQLEFMYFLTGKEALADDHRSAAAYRWAQKDFLERHLAVWLPRFCDDVAGKASAFYAALAAVLRLFIEHEHLALAGEPSLQAAS